MRRTFEPRLALLLFPLSLLSSGCTPAPAASDDAGPLGADGSAVDGGGTVGDGGAPDAGGDAACTPVSIEAVPLDLYVMLDQSGSMGDAVAGGGTRWDATVAGLTAWLTEVPPVPTAVGVQYYGLPSGVVCPVTCATDADCGACGPCLVGVCAGGADSCEPTDYAIPDVDVQALPGVAAGIETSLAAHAPGPGSAIHPALVGAIQHAASLAAARPGHHVGVVLFMDGEPTSCDTSTSAITSAAAAGASGTTPTRTAVVSVGAFGAFAHAVAAAGGTESALMVDLGAASVAAEVQAAMGEVRRALGADCELGVPTGLDAATLALELTTGAGPSSIVGRVDDAAACATSPGWYALDRGGAPVIALCPASCAASRADPTARFAALDGC